ncbi:hypothetical protein RND71_011843 [Anisodus tanguticus]|uniref:Uncharacterized protein n=1 Tax=Anisodus tanguticus TaxID=243964 RepID=A0AAE1VL90_9SOLA|nr:hypothetical protein RND71_011843 [Anisodus tanguticus]
MEHFLASQVEITYVLDLYPSIIVPKSSSIPEPQKFADVADAPNFSQGSSGLSDDLDSTPLNVLESDEMDIESKKMSHNTLMALIKYLQKKRYTVIEKATAEGTEEVVSDVVGDNFISYKTGRSKKPTKGRIHAPITSIARDMAAMLNTALLQALLLTGQSSAATDFLKALNYCDVKICEEFLQKRSQYACLLEFYRSNSMHHEALKLLHQLPLCATDPMLVLEFSLPVLESCPMQTIELFLSGNIPADLVNSYLKQHAPNMQATYLELMLAMNENSISRNLQNEMVQIYLSEVLDLYAELNSQQKWDEKTCSPTRKKLLSALESISGYNPEGLLKRLPPDALYEERAILLGKMTQHELALSIYVHKLHVPELALSYCDRVYDSGLQQHSAKSYGNIYLTLLQIYLNPTKATKNFEKKITNLPWDSKSWFRNSIKVKGSRSKKIAEIEGAEDTRFSPSGTDSGRSDRDTEDAAEEGETIMLDEVLDLLSRRWDRIHGAQALKLLPKDTKLQVKDELYNQRKTVLKITSDSMCSLCNKKIGTSVFAVYPNGKTIVHFVCFRDSQNMKAVGRGSQLRKR